MADKLPDIHGHKNNRKTVQELMKENSYQFNQDQKKSLRKEINSNHHSSSKASNKLENKSFKLDLQNPGFTKKKVVPSVGKVSQSDTPVIT